jgi:hypothetical protein
MLHPFIHPLVDPFVRPFRSIRFVAAAAGLVTLAATSAGAQSAPAAPAVTANGAVTGLRAFSSDMGEGGSAEWNDVTVSANVKRQFVPAFSAGLALSYDRQDWSFDPAATFGGAAPWGVLQRPGVGLSLSLALSPSVLTGITTSAEWAAAEGVSASDALTYGVTVSALKVFSPKFVLGGGAKVFRQFYSVKTSPFVIVNWQLNDKLRIANAIPAGPEGGAGVELRYVPAKDWEVAAGGVWRSDRFRLKDIGPYARDIGEASSIPLLARLSRNVDAKTRIDLYAGALVNGTLKVKDGDGHELGSEKWGPAPALALTVSRKL